MAMVAMMAMAAMAAMEAMEAMMVAMEAMEAMVEFGLHQVISPRIPSKSTGRTPKSFIRVWSLNRSPMWVGRPRRCVFTMTMTLVRTTFTTWRTSSTAAFHPHLQGSRS